MKAARGFIGLLCLLLVWGATAQTAWDRISQNGELRVGVKIDYPPFGMLDDQGGNIGFEVEMAQRLAAALGVRASLYAVTGANRLQKLEDGTVDLVIATLGITPLRRTQATLIEPGYYASGVGLMTPQSLRFTDWHEVRGQTICAVQGSYFNPTLAQRHLLNLQIYPSAREARQALRDGRCSGWLFDQPAIDWALSQGDNRWFHTTLPPLLNVGWAMAISKAERDGRLHRWLQAEIGTWHREGYFLELEQRWHMPASPQLASLHQRWSHPPHPHPPCEVTTPAGTPKPLPHECLSALPPQDDELLQSHALKTWTGGLAYTLGLTLACVTLSLGLGLGLARRVMARSEAARNRWRQALGLMRMTPPLLVMGLFFFGIGGLMQRHLSWQPSGALIAVGCLSAYAGSSIFMALDQTHEHLRAHGATPVWHQVMGLAWPAIKGVLINVSKATMMASALAVPELLSVSTTLMAETGQVAWAMNLMLLAYVALGLAVMGALDRLERRLRPTLGP